MADRIKREKLTDRHFNAPCNGCGVVNGETAKHCEGSKGFKQMCSSVICSHCWMSVRGCQHHQQEAVENKKKLNQTKDHSGKKKKTNNASPKAEIAQQQKRLAA